MKTRFIIFAAFLILAACTTEKDPVVNYKLYLDCLRGSCQISPSWEIRTSWESRTISTWWIGAGGKDFDCSFTY